MRTYFYELLRYYLSLFILPQNTSVEIDPANALLGVLLTNGKVAFTGRRDVADQHIAEDRIVELDAIREIRPDYIVVSGGVHHERDIQGLLRSLHQVSHPQSRLIMTYYSNVWRPIMGLAATLGLRKKTPEVNWLSHGDVENLLLLENFELIRRDSKVLMPLYIPLLSDLINRYIAPLPLFRAFSLVNIVVARPVMQTIPQASASIIVPARNEAGNIESIVERIPRMGPDDEIIFVEGNSTDNTWEVLQRIQQKYGAERRIVITQQEGKGKGDAVRKGFGMARNEVLMILDADMTVPPEDLPKFYEAIMSNKGEFINGSRLVYPMHAGAMRFMNLIGNKFFALAFSFVLSQRFKDTLCGTKVLTKSNYEKLASNRSYFGNFDPFGDFDLIFGAARMCLKIVEVPIVYRERVYGETNISRWRHGIILLAMLMFSARRIKFL
ncbi:glycosyltransferase [Tardiphaga sp. 862_B3_N4_1]|uniref:glycosyltransferase n=1 Tax=Tardiphaga sp. 862_B3_N4_1 TaxID=3240764 RepID=UPI003F1FAF73